jgi:hypothetical protein
VPDVVIPLRNRGVFNYGDVADVIDRVRANRSRRFFTYLWKALIVLALCMPSLAVPRKEKDSGQYGAGLTVNVPYSETEVVKVVQDVVQNGIIRGTKEYAKDEYVKGAASASSTRVFPEWTEGGKVFYKVRLKALDPWNFKDSSDMGTLAVRYIVQAQDDSHTVLRIDARFVEDFRHIGHASNGSVEGAEYKSIHDRLESLDLMKTQAAEAEKAKQEAVTKSEPPTLKDETPPAAAPAPASPTIDNAASAPTTSAPAPSLPSQTVEERVKDLRRQVQRQVKAPGAALKSAPFHTATTLEALSPGTQVLIVITTPYWLGVETHEGRHGWILRDELELLP